MITTMWRARHPRRAARIAGLLRVVLVTALTACDAFTPSPLGVSPNSPNGGVTLAYRTFHEASFGFQRLSTDGTRVFASDGNGGIIAIDMATGASVWTVRRESASELGEVALDGARVYTASDSARGWDAATGTLLWTRKLSSWASGNIGYAGEGQYYIGTDSTIFALDGATGEILWRKGVSDGWAYSGRVRSIAGDATTLYACVGEPLEWNGWRTRGHVVALDRATGEIRWRHVMAYETSFNFCIGEPTLAGDLVIVSDAGGNNYVALERSTGTLRWRHRGELGWIGPHSSPVAVGETLYAASGDQNIIALDRASGRVIWKSQTLSSAQAAARCGSVVLANAFTLWVFDARDGRELGREISMQISRDEIMASRFLVHDGYAYIVGLQRFYKWRCPK